MSLVTQTFKFLSLVAYSVYYAEVIQHPANDTFCEGTDAILYCTIFDNSTSNIADDTVWFNVKTGAAISGSRVNNSRDGDVVTSVLTLVKAPLSLNNTEYVCEPTITVESSSVAVIIVIGENSTHTHIHTHTQPHMHTHISPHFSIHRILATYYIVISMFFCCIFR